jgi:23S rRNA pseudouridine1911/1915/1917 synthase
MALTASEVIVRPEQAGLRLDLFLARHLLGGASQGWPSRSAVQKMIGEGAVKLNGLSAKAATRLKVGDVVEFQCLPAREIPLEPEDVRLWILYEDRHCLVLNKPPGIVVHPGAGHARGTLVNALLHHCPDLEGIGGERRPGIVHRLDKGTSGAIVVAKHGEAYYRLAAQFKKRKVLKEYFALVWGKPKAPQGVIARPVGRQRGSRVKMSSVRALPSAREAITEWWVEEVFRVSAAASRFSRVSRLRLRPRTGRTHQIRVHLADQGYPIVGDPLYGPSRQTLSGEDLAVAQLKDARFQQLHAERLGFYHPASGEWLEVRAPLFEDLRRLWESLRAYAE